MISNKSLASALIISLSIVSCGQKTNWWKRHNKGEAPPSSTAPEVSPPAMQNDPVYNSQLTNTDSLISGVNLKPWLLSGFHGKSLTIAILDNGFGGLDASLGKRLPPDLNVAASPIDNLSPSPHGTKLAEVIFAMTSGSPVWTPQSQSPKIKLYNSNGFTNFSAAVDQAIADNVDVILYSQVWEFGGNFDGGGFINEVVRKATTMGILWINAAGNYAASSWQGPLLINADKTAYLPHEGRYVRMSVRNNDTPVKITLAWNDFADNKSWRTSRDLDLTLLDNLKQVITAGAKIQDGLEHKGDPQYSAHARETIEMSLPAGQYFLRVDIRSNNFDGFSRIRLAADGDGVMFTDISPDASIMIPADNPSVLTIGASDDTTSSAGRTGSGLNKPELVAPSALRFDSGVAISGSSSAAAVAAATLIVYQDACGRMSRGEIMRGILTGHLARRSFSGQGLWLPPICLGH